MGVKQQKIVSVDIGQSSLNIVLGGGQGMITKAATVKVPSGVIQNSRIISHEMLAAALREAKALAGISAKNAVLVIGGREVIIRYFNLPKMSDFHLYENIVSELSPYLPFSADNYTIDYAIKNIIKDGSSVEYSVMVVAVHNDIIEPYIEVFKQAGLKLVRIDIRDNSYEKLLKALSKKTSKERKNFCVIDIGAASTTISAYHDSKFFINNTNSVGGEYFRDAIATLYDTDSLRAEEKKFQISKLSYDNQDKDVMDLMNNFFEKIVTDATRVFEFFKSNNDQASIEEIFLCGGSSAINGMAAYVESSSDIITTELGDLMKTLFSSKIVDGLNLEVYCSAVGATFWEVD